MNIIIAQGHQPPPNPNGVTVIIDVIRAFTTSYYAFMSGVTRIWPVATAEEAFTLKQAMPEAKLAGEVNALPIEGFNFGNSPWEVKQADLQDKPLIMRTTNGVIATLNAQPCKHLLVTGLATAKATVAAIQTLDVEQVVLVASHPTGDEDVACAEYMAALLGEEGISAEEAHERTYNAAAAKKFLANDNPMLRPMDIDLAADYDVGNFAMQVKQESGQIYICPLAQ